MAIKYLTCFSTLVGAGIGVGVGCSVGALLSFAIEGNVGSSGLVLMLSYIGMMIGGSIGCILSGPRTAPSQALQRNKQHLETISIMAPGYNIAPSALARLGLPPEQSELSLREPVLPLTPSKSPAPPSKSSAPPTPRQTKTNPLSFVYVPTENHLKAPSR